MTRRAEIEITPEIDEWATTIGVAPNWSTPAGEVARQIIASRPPAIEAGVRVKSTNKKATGTVAAVNRPTAEAWVDWDGVGLLTEDMVTLEVIP